jgi:hypothetical protein
MIRKKDKDWNLHWIWKDSNWNQIEFQIDWTENIKSAYPNFQIFYDL